MTARDLPPWRCRGQLRLPLVPEHLAEVDEVDVAAVFADMQRLDVDLTDVDTDDPPQTTAGNTTPKDTVTETDPHRGIRPALDRHPTDRADRTDPRRPHRGRPATVRNRTVGPEPARWAPSWTLHHAKKSTGEKFTTTTRTPSPSPCHA
jgi:hypothetical protein